MPDGTGLDILREKIPHNYYDVGIAEEHAVTLQLVLQLRNNSVLAIYSTFLQRGF